MSCMLSAEGSYEKERWIVQLTMEMRAEYIWLLTSGTRPNREIIHGSG